MDITQKPNLKPLRDYDEHEVINFYALDWTDTTATVGWESGRKGALVKIDPVTALGNTNVRQGGAGTPYMNGTNFAHSNAPGRATVLQYDVSWKVQVCKAGDSDVLGIMLYDTMEKNAYGELYAFRPRIERAEKDIVIPGEAVPVLVRGIVKINGFEGTDPVAGDTGNISANADGFVEVNGAGTKVGKFLTSPDADGYALFKLEL